MLDRDRNSQLLVGLLALHEKLVPLDALIDAVARWHRDGENDLSSVLRKHGLSSEDNHRLHDLAERRLTALSDLTCADGTQLLTNLAPHETTANPDDTDWADLVSTASVAGSAPPETAVPGSHQFGTSSAMRFRVLRPHAKGGLGEVFVAQDLELNREVALKEIRRKFANHSDSRTRFVQEAEITGGLEHPCIVPVYGLGQYADGRPFYAMRFIRGSSLSDAIKAFHAAETMTWSSGEALLKLRELLRRFCDVCNAIEYAHSRDVLHRDLKPANVMLGNYGETLVVDWGLAKIVGQVRGVQTSESGQAPLRGYADQGEGTQTGQVVGTPAFMSPEQAAGDLNQLGPASDVYSLGATLYCLLTGRPAFIDGNAASILEKVRSGDFPPPSSIQPLVPRPLESVCLRAMALRPEARYPSPKMLVDDINRWLADESVDAHQESIGERVSRLGRRHKSAARAGALALCAVTLVAIVAALLINEQRGRAEVLADANGRLAISERDAKEDAQLSAERNRRVLGYLVSAFRKPDPEQDGLTVTVASVLEQAKGQLNLDLQGDTVEKATLLDAIGETYRGLGLYEAAILAHAEALELRKMELGEQNPDTLTSMNNLALSYQMAGKIEEAFPLWQHTLELRRAILGEGNQDTLTSMNNLAIGYQLEGREKEAIALFEAALDLTRAKMGSDSPDTYNSMLNLGAAYNQSRQRDKALPILKDAVELMREHFGPEDPRTLVATGHLAQAYRATAQFDLAIPLFEQNLASQRAKLTKEHPDTLMTQGGLGATYLQAGEIAKAVATLSETLELQSARIGPDHPQTLITMGNLAVAFEASGDRDKALSLYEESLKLKRLKLPADHRDVLTALNHLATAYEADDRPSDAIKLFEEVLRRRQSTLGGDHLDTLAAMNQLAQCYQAAGQLNKAVPLFKSAYDRMASLPNARAADTLALLGNLAVAYQLDGQLGQAKSLQEQALQQASAQLGPTHPTTLTAMINLGLCQDHLGKHEVASQLFQDGLQQLRATLGDKDRTTRYALDAVQNVYLKSQQFSQAEAINREWLDGLGRAHFVDARDFAAPRIGLAEALLGQDKLDEALEQAQTAIGLKRDDHAISVMGGILARQSKWDQAAPQLLSSYEALRKALPSLPIYERWYVSRACERIIAMYEAQGNSDEVAKWRKELDAVNAEIARLRGPVPQQAPEAANADRTQ